MSIDWSNPREVRERNKQYRRANPEKIKSYKLKECFGIDLLRYNEMFARQNGLCAGCYRHQSEFKRRFAVDHDHKTGTIRGLLCGRCNSILGYAYDNMETLRRLAEYLDKTSSVNNLSSLKQ